MEEPTQEKEKMTTTKKPPSWKKLKRKLRERSEADGEFQDGEYEEPLEEVEYVYEDD